MKHETAVHQTPSNAWYSTSVSGVVTLLLALAALFLPFVENVPKSGFVGWLLVLAGSVEFLSGLKRRRSLSGRAAFIAGMITALSGGLFVVLPPAGYLPVANVVIAWLLLRGAWLLGCAWRARRTVGVWVAFSGTADLLLGLALMLNLSIGSLVLTLFGATAELVTSFAVIFAASFIATGISQIVIGLSERGEASSR